LFWARLPKGIEGEEAAAPIVVHHHFHLRGLDQIGVEIGGEDGLAGLVNLLEEGFFILGTLVLGILPGLASGGSSCNLLKSRRTDSRALGAGRPFASQIARKTEPCN
jgi:hypothetical protein